MNERAFTLFTALISFILIVLSTLLVNNMTATASNTGDIISSIEEQTEMQAIADLARADALQAFNYNVRYKLEDYFLKPENIFYFNSRDWDKIQEEFARAFFVDPEKEENKFAAIMTSNIENILDDPPPIRGYKTELISTDRSSMRDALQKTILTEGLFEVVGCENGNVRNCPLGTFYINIRLDLIDDADYEKLPQIRVENLANGRVIREPILPRQKLRIYVPLRIFKAMAIARETAELNLDFIAGNMDDWSLGVCDGQCKPQALLARGGATTAKGLCPGDSGTALSIPQVPRSSVTIGNGSQKYPLIPIGGTKYTYNPNNEDSASDAMKGLMKDRLCGGLASMAVPENLEQEHQFRLLGNACNNGAPVSNVENSAKAIDTAVVQRIGYVPGEVESSYTASCTKPDKIGYTLAFEELNERYRVNQQTYDSLSEPAFKVMPQISFEYQLNSWGCRSEATESNNFTCN